MTPAAAQEARIPSFEELAYLSCSEAQAMEPSGGVAVARFLADRAAAHYGIALADNEAVGQELGILVRGGCTMFPQALLFGVIAQAVRSRRNGSRWRGKGAARQASDYVIEAAWHPAPALIEPHRFPQPDLMALMRAASARKGLSDAPWTGEVEMIVHTRAPYALRVLLAGALTAAVVVIGPGSAVAQAVAPPEAGLTSALEGEAGDTADEWSFTIGGGAGFAPDYEGSEDYEAVPLLLARVQRNEIFVALEANTLRANLLPVPVFQAGPLVRYRPERDDVENDTVDDLEDVDAAVELGGFVGFEAEGWHGRVEVTQDVADAYDGLLVGLRGGYRAVLRPNLSLNTTAFTTYASDDYMETYFGIDGADAARSGLDTFDADAGFKDVGLSLAARYGGREGWGVTGIAAYKRLLNDAEDSPVVDDEGDANQLFAGLLITYGF